MQEPPEGEKRFRADAAEEQAAQCHFCDVVLSYWRLMVINSDQYWLVVINNG